MIDLALKHFKQTVVERVQREPMFARAMLEEAASLLLNGDPATARVVLRNLVNAPLVHPCDTNVLHSHKIRPPWSVS